MTRLDREWLRVVRVSKKLPFPRLANFWDLLDSIGYARKPGGDGTKSCKASYRHVGIGLGWFGVIALGSLVWPSVVWDILIYFGLYLGSLAWDLRMSLDIFGSRSSV